MQNTIVTISSRNPSSFAHRLARETLLFRQTMQGLTLLKKCRTCCAENGLRLAIHRPDSPDLPPSDFFLFGYANDRLQGIVFASREELLAGINEILDEIPPRTLPRVFEDWIERLK
jgi:hypothetical protein